MSYNVKERISRIAERWWLTEPAFFAVYCSHSLAENGQMKCVMRTGERCIEYNPTLAEPLGDEALEEYLKVECFHILLKHPYERQPECCKPEPIALAGNFVVDQNYQLHYFECPKAHEFQLPNGESFEWYALKLNNLIGNNGDASDDSWIPADGVQPSEDNDNEEQNQNESSEDSDQQKQDQEQAQGKKQGNDQGQEQSSGQGENEEQENGKGDSNGQDQNEEQTNGNGGNDEQTTGNGGSQTQSRGQGQGNSDNPYQQWADYSGLWEEDLLAQEETNELIRKLEASQSWGTIPGHFAEMVVATLKVKLNYKAILRSFHTSILCSRRRLTRMRPNRRSGFQQMGSRYELASNILVCVDVSGSVSSHALSTFYSAIARFFKYGVETIDVLPFDAGLKELTTLKKAPKEVKIEGRGGTDFQILFDYIAKHPRYDGMIIFTDGYAPEPKVPQPMHAKVLWICDSEQNCERHHEWMRKSGKAAFIS
jgi:predicted metal-dependent peptidase